MTYEPLPEPAPDRPHTAPVTTARTTTSSPAVLLLTTALAIFAGEVGVMFILPLFRPMPIAVEAVLDGLLLTTLAAPVLYLLLFRPMVLHIEEHHRAEAALNELNATLERRVRERTEELEAANASLGEVNRSLETANVSLERANTNLQREIRERTEIDARLQRTSGFLQRLTEGTPCLMCVVDVPSLACRYVNGRIHDFLGWDPDAAVVAGTDFLRRLVAPDDLQAVTDLVRELATADEHRIVRRHCRLLTVDGRLESFRLGLTPLSRQDRDHADEVLLVAVPVLDD
jgi:PAS domain-containing protein